MKLWTSLLFLHGHVADPALAVELAKDEAQPAGRAAASAPRTSAPARAMRGRPTTFARLLREFLFLGGRPMTAGHNDDLEEPFPQLASAGKRKAQRARGQKSLRRAAAVAACSTALSPFR